MPQVPGTKIWLRKKELNTVCRAIEAADPPARTAIAQDYALYNVRRAKQAKSNAERVFKFIMYYWFNLGFEGRPIDSNIFNEIMAEGQ